MNSACGRVSLLGLSSVLTGPSGHDISISSTGTMLTASSLRSHTVPSSSLSGQHQARQGAVITPTWEMGRLCGQWGSLCPTPAAAPGRALTSPSCLPHAPLTSQPLAMAKPPPRRRMMFQGTVSWALFHVSKGTVSVLGAGQREDTQLGRGYPAPITIPLPRAGEGPDTLSGPSTGEGNISPWSPVSMGTCRGLQENTIWLQHPI